MAEHIRSAPSHEGDESQPPGGETDHASPEVSDPINPALSTSSLPEIENATIAPVSRHAAPSRSSSSSSRAAAGDDRTQLQKFIQDNDSDDEDVARLDAILHGLEKDQIHQRSEYAGNQSALDMAVERGMLWAVRRLLDYELQDKSILAEVDGDGRQALHLACLNGHRDIAALLLDQGAAIEATQSFGATPLDEACWKGHTAVVELLLSRHAKTQVIDNDGWSPIRSATQFERKDIVKVLLETDDANVNLADTDGETPLHVASRKGYDAIITQLLKHKADVNVLDGQKRTPVMLASQNGHVTCIKILCKARANCNFQADEDDGNNTALHYALEYAGDELPTFYQRERCQHEMVIELLKWNADPGIQNIKRETASHLAARSGNFDTYKAILEKMEGEKKRLENQEGDTALGLALKARSVDIVKCMTEKDSAELFDSEDEMEALLWTAQEKENHSHAELLFRERKNLRSPLPPEDSDRWSAIQWAAHLKMPSVLWLLLATSKPIETRNARQLALNEAEAETSPKEKKGTGDTKPTNRSAQHEAQTEIEGRGKGNEEKELIKDGDPRTTDKPKARSTREQNKMLVLAILRDPPPTITSGEEERLQRPKTGTKQGDFLRKWVSKAAVIKYNVNNDKSTFFTQFRNVYEVIYGTGPTNITKEPTKTLEEMKRMNGSTIYQKICKLQEDRLGESLFTWVHLPATNIVWMNDLLKRILIDDPSALDDPQPEDCLSSKDGGAPEKLKTLESDGVDEKPKKTAEEGEDLEKPKKALTKSGDRERAKKASKVNSFFKASWSQIPDRISESRIMKPDYTTEPMRQETKGTESGGKIDESIVDSPENSLNAIYLPYLTLSIQRRGQDVDNIDQDSGKEEQKKKGKERERGKEDEVKGRKDRKEEDPRDEKLRGAHEAYLSLLKSYKGKVIHGSATLDESFYHFCRSQQNDDQGQEHSQPQEDRQIDEEEAAQQKDRQRRNESQVVTKGIHGDVAERPDWTLVRVNQLWVWIVGRKWLVTATTHPIDQFEDPFLTDVRDHIEKQARAEGREVRARSPLEMAKIIVGYCIDSYDQQPKPKVYGTNHSIRQIFSDSINKIARLDARLFEDFCERIGAKELKKEDKARVGEGGIPKEEEEAPRKRGKADRNEHTEDAIKAAASLSAKIRDIRDELQMLQAIAKHQMRVQKKLENGSYADAGLWENYITSDIGDMIGAADRIKSNVEMTLSLEQSQIANNQATESVKQSRLANKQADASVKQSKLANEQAKESVRQGRTLMIFTAITAFFLPSSFLSSLFALDVDSFRKAPYWAFLIIFLVSAALALPFLYILWLREINRSADGADSSKDGRDGCKDGGKERTKATGSKEDRYVACGWLVAWPRRRKENPSDV